MDSVHIASQENSPTAARCGPLPFADGWIARFSTLDEFAYLKEEALRFGFRHVESGPLVRSSYHAHEQAGIAAER